MKQLFLRGVRRLVIKRLKNAGFGNQLINDVLRALKLRETGLPKFMNPPAAPEKRRDPKKDIGKRAINWVTDKAGIIADAWKDSETEFERFDILVLDDTTVWGHRHYFFIEGDDKTGDLFELNKHKYFP